MRNVSLKVANKLNIARISDFVTGEPTVYAGTNVVFCVDVSGSMYSELPKLRTQLKNKLAEIMDKNDTVSILWFSGKGECGVVQEVVKIKDVKKLKVLNDMIDKFLQTVGVTSFDGPINLTQTVVKNIRKDNQNPINFIFLSDGGHNDGAWSDVEKAMDNLAPVIDSTTIIEYGFYADSDRLTQMAERLGGSKIFSKNFDDYEAQIESVIAGKVGKRIEVDITSFKKSLKQQFLVSYDADTNSVSTYSSDRKDSISVPEGVTELYALTTEESVDGTMELAEAKEGLLSLIVGLSDRWKFELVEQLITFSKFKELIDKFGKSYGKQGINEFKDSALELIQTDIKDIEIATKAYKVSAKAYCVLDLLGDLMEGNNLVNIYSPLFQYSRTGAVRTARKILTSQDRAKLSTSKSVKDAGKVLEEVKGTKFTPNPANGYSLTDLTWNSDRANVSMKFKIEGKVKLPTNEFGLDSVDTFIWRNYTIIKDSILNFSELPVFLDDATFKKLSKKIPNSLQSIGDNEYLIDLAELPLINKSYIQKADLQGLAEKEALLMANKAEQKYLNYLKKSSTLGTIKKGTREFTKAELEFLKDQGVDMNKGYSPLTDKVESKDFYMAPRLRTRVKGCSNLPSIEAVTKKIDENKKLNAGDELISTSIEKYDDNLTDKKLQKELESNKKAVRTLIKEVAIEKFSLIMGRKPVPENEVYETSEGLAVDFVSDFEKVDI